MQCCSRAPSPARPAGAAPRPCSQRPWRPSPAHSRRARQTTSASMDSLKPRTFGAPQRQALATSAARQASLRGLLEAINDSTKWAVSAAAFATLLARRDLVSAWCVLGGVAAAANCRALKFLINQSRPADARKADPGMPSAHANSLAFLSTYVSVAAAPATLLETPLGTALMLGTPVLGIFLAWLRVALGYHSFPQVAVGWLVGSSAAAAWWSLGQSRVLPAAAAQPHLAAGLFGATAVAVALFSVQNVARWAREHCAGAGAAPAAKEA